jgi:hypothetical protein
MPRACLDWDEVEAAKQVIKGAADVAIGGPAALAVFEARPDKSRKFQLFRPFSGTVEDHWMEPVGLVRTKSGTVSLAAQNMIAFLTDIKAQAALANGYQALPLVAKAQAEFGVVSKGITPAMDVFVASVTTFGVAGVPLAPLSSDRDRLAAALRQTLVDAVNGMPVDVAIAKGKASFESGR